MAVVSYPWDRLARVSRRDTRAARRVRDVIGPLFLAGRPDTERVAEAAAELLSAPVAISAQAPVSSGDVASERAVVLETADGAVSFAVELEPALVTLVVARVLGRRDHVTATDAPLADDVRGALAAVLVETARRAGMTVPLRAEVHDERDDATDHDGPRARFDVTVTVGGRPYHAALSVVPRALPTTGAPSFVHDVDYGALPIRIPLVAARSLGERAELAALVPGDVWLPGDGWLATPTHTSGPEPATDATVLAARLLSRAALSPSTSERGIGVGRSDDGKLVLRGDLIALDAEAAETTHERGGDEAMSGTEETLTSMALDAPIVVRVEVGSVTLTAREWGALKPGDVLETGLRLAEPAVLRVAGREVARGELVSVDGELGVRIRELVRE
ncbi:MAG TPA: FliM/FliN family flagellar motor switch protein [Polyangiaceae bacterium]|nr:FliM/FliN family flagellar motor switch protein [Polyangiaceae bacterium]